jgi:hypothetical protein
MGTTAQPRLLSERPTEAGIALGPKSPGARPMRSVTINIAESPLGWPARASRVVLTLALDRIADYYRAR